MSCKKMKPVLEELARKYEGKVAVRMIDLRDAEGEAIARTRRVHLIPTQVLLDADGRERFRHEGFISLDDLESEITRLGWTR
jgi:thioredoxin 1